MKWGTTRASKGKNYIIKKAKQINNNEKDYRKKLNTISKNKNLNNFDKRLITYRNKNIAKRTLNVATGKITGQLVSDVLTGQIGNYKTMSKLDMSKKLKKLAVNTAGGVAFNDTLARSASKKFTESGKYKKGKNGFLNREEMISASVNTAINVIPIIGAVTNMKLSAVKKNRMKNEQTFNRWGSRILNEGSDNYVYGSYKI